MMARSASRFEKASSNKFEKVDSYRAISSNRLYRGLTEYDDQSRLTLLQTDNKHNENTVPVKLSCRHEVCNSLIKKDILGAEKVKSLVGLKP